jgi:hypothetical protein
MPSMPSMFQSTKAISGAPSVSRRWSASAPSDASDVSCSSPRKSPFMYVRMNLESSTISVFIGGYWREWAGMRACPLAR